MRITHDRLGRDLLAGIQRNLSRIDQTQASIVTGRRLRAASDDPVAAASVMRVASDMRAFAQFRRNIGAAQVRLATEEGTLSRLTDVLTRAREIAIAQGGATADDATRLTAAAEVERLIETVTNLGDARVNGSYLFGGQTADRRPFNDTGVLADGIAGGLEIEIGSGTVVAVNHNAQEVFGDTGVLTALRRLHEGLTGNNPDLIQQSAGELDGAFDRVQDLLGEVGARWNHLSMISENMENVEFELRVQRSNLEDVDLEEALIELATRQAALQAALLTTSQILSLRLTDYIR